jgi:hypothetical protein
MMAGNAIEGKVGEKTQRKMGKKKHMEFSKTIYSA